MPYVYRYLEAEEPSEYRDTSRAALREGTREPGDRALAHAEGLPEHAQLAKTHLPPIRAWQEGNPRPAVYLSGFCILPETGDINEHTAHITDNPGVVFGSHIER